MKQLWKYMKGYEKECILGPLFKLLEATFELLIPLVVARIVDQGIGGGNQGYVLRMSLVMIILGIIGLAMAVSAQYFSAAAAVGFSTRLRHAVMEHILGLSYSQIDKMGSSTMVTRMTSDINQLQNGVNLGLRLLLRSPFVVLGAMVMAFTIDAQAAKAVVDVTHPRVVIPMHYRRGKMGFAEIAELSDFTDRFSGVRYEEGPLELTKGTPRGVIVLTPELS